MAVVAGVVTVVVAIAGVVTVVVAVAVVAVVVAVAVAVAVVVAVVVAVAVVAVVVVVVVAVVAGVVAVVAAIDNVVALMVGFVAEVACFVRATASFKKLWRRDSTAPSCSASTLYSSVTVVVEVGFLGFEAKSMLRTSSIVAFSFSFSESAFSALVCLRK